MRIIFGLILIFSPFITLFVYKFGVLDGIMYSIFTAITIFGIALILTLGVMVIITPYDEWFTGKK